MRALKDNSRAIDPRTTIIVTFGNPMSDHLIGLELKQKYGMPWLAHFSDPWIENPFKHYSWFTMKLNSSLERRVVEQADRLVYTSLETSEVVLKKFGENIKRKAQILPHAYDESLYPQTLERSTSKIVIRYLGDLLWSTITCSAVSRASENSDLTAGVNSGCLFRFAGSTVDLKGNDLIFERLPKGLVVFRPTVDYLTSLSLMSSADGLLVIDAPAETSIFLPSKLIDYIGAARPVLGITPDGTAAKLINELGDGWRILPNDEEIERYFCLLSPIFKTQGMITVDRGDTRLFGSDLVLVL
jgi:hypothetical protein